MVLIIPLRWPPLPAAALQTVQDFRLTPAAAAAIHRTPRTVDNPRIYVDNRVQVFVEEPFCEELPACPACRTCSRRTPCIGQPARPARSDHRHRSRPVILL